MLISNVFRKFTLHKNHSVCIYLLYMNKLCVHVSMCKHRRNEYCYFDDGRAT